MKVTFKFLMSTSAAVFSLAFIEVHLQLEPLAKIFVMLDFCLCHRYINVWLKRTYRVVWIRHCVERSNSQRIFIQNIEVGIILHKKQKCQWHPDYKSYTFDNLGSNENIFIWVILLLSSTRTHQDQWKYERRQKEEKSVTVTLTV